MILLQAASFGALLQNNDEDWYNGNGTPWMEIVVSKSAIFWRRRSTKRANN